jgi:hypothetical protein
MSSHPEDMNPHEEPPALGSFGRPGSSGLGSLAQSARGKHLKTARRIMIVIGVLMAIGQTVMFFIESGTIKDEIQKEIRHRGLTGRVTQEEIQEAEQAGWRILLFIHGATALLGVVFIVLGFMVEKSPVAITATALVLFIGKEVIFALFSPINIVSGLIVKIIFIVALVKALQAAIAFQREQRAVAAAGEYSA